MCVCEICVDLAVYLVTVRFRRVRLATVVRVTQPGWLWASRVRLATAVRVTARPALRFMSTTGDRGTCHTWLGCWL